MILEITQDRANQMSEAFMLGTGNIKAIETTCRDTGVFMTVDRHLVGVIEYKILEDKPKSRKCEHGMFPWECSHCDEIAKHIDIREYTDCFTVTIDKEEFMFNGISEPESMMNLLKKLNIDFDYDEIANNHR